MTVCDSKQRMQRALDGLGAKTVSELPAKLGARRATLHGGSGATGMIVTVRVADSWV